jgi:hypothetical protein
LTGNGHLNYNEFQEVSKTHAWIACRRQAKDWEKMAVYEVAIRYAAAGQSFFNVVHYDITGDTPLDLQSLTDEIANAWVNECALRVAGAVTLEDITYRLDIEGSVGQTVVPTGGAKNGLAGDNQWAGQLAVLVQKKTNGFVRPVRGWAFQPGITSEGLNSSGEWTVAVAQDVEDFWDAIILVPFAGNGQAEMLLKASNPTAPNTNAYNSVVECDASTNPAALQSRKKGRGV